MRKIMLVPLVMLVILLAAGCGGGGGGSSEPPSHEVQILSDEQVDGYIVEEPNAPFQKTVVLGTATMFAGVDPVTDREFRSFIDFPLDVVPNSAVIDSASLDITVRSVALAGSAVPVEIQLVSFTPPIIPTDFDQLAPLIPTSIAFNVRASDAGHHVVVDVTPLMQEAQRRNLSDFQIRVLENLDATVPGLIEIDESTNSTAPALDVVYH